MKKPRRIEYADLRNEVAAGALPFLIGRREDAERLTRIVGRRMNNNALIVGQGGAGKSALVHGWVRSACRNPKYKDFAFVQFGTSHLDALESTDIEQLDSLTGSLPQSVLVIDDFGRALYSRQSVATGVFKAYLAILQKPEVRIFATMEPHELSWLEREYPALVSRFEVVQLKEQPENEQMRILRSRVPHLNKEHRVLVPHASLAEIVSYTKRFPALGAMPRAGIALLDECLSHTSANGRQVLETESVAHVVSSKLGLPAAAVGMEELSTLSSLTERLSARVVGQEGAIEKIATTLQRAKLGLRNPNRPLGSFLMLGPSGVGKTETAKVVAETVFGRSEAFMRIDMSEYQQEHTVQRLIGSPAGYIGYSEGGALTNLLKREPHSLILLDEIEKAHPKVFDIFLQFLDDGRLTSGQNEVVDARNSIIMATSNAGVDRILAALAKGKDVTSDAFLQKEIIPALTETFRLEFLNRFDSILIFNPLSVPALIEIAELEMRKTQERLKRHKVQFSLDRASVERHIRQIADPRFGARPVKRFIEDTCESLLAESLLSKRS